MSEQYPYHQQPQPQPPYDQYDQYGQPVAPQPPARADDRPEARSPFPYEPYQDHQRYTQTWEGQTWDTQYQPTIPPAQPPADPGPGPAPAPAPRRGRHAQPERQAWGAGAGTEGVEETAYLPPVRPGGPEETAYLPPVRALAEEPVHVPPQSPQYAQDPQSSAYAQDPQSSAYAQDPQYSQGQSSQYSQYAQDPSPRYAQDPSARYAQDPSARYAQDPSARYAQGQQDFQSSQNLPNSPNPQNPMTGTASVPLPPEMPMPASSAAAVPTPTAEPMPSGAGAAHGPGGGPGSGAAGYGQGASRPGPTAGDGPAYSPPTTTGNARITDAQRARAEGRSPIIAPGMQPAALTAVLGLLLAVAAPVGPYALVVPLIALQAVTAAGWFRLNGMWPARQGIALAFAGGLVADVALLGLGRENAPAAILGTLGVWVLLTLVLQLRSHADPDERMYGLMATVASAALAILAGGYLAAPPHAVSVGAAAVAVAVLARALPLPSAASVAVALLAAAGAGIAVGGLTGIGASGALLGLAAGVCALVGLRVASYDYPSRFVHMTAGVALPLTAAVPVLYLVGRAVG
ncbi:hypothetical protein [Streptomyces sp. NPDC048111]|uniref:hypothetical protein n=1 Tax=Streptomyces sp. NPDC048111 TaxID=3365500 RepID=UPI00371A4C74